MSEQELVDHIREVICNWAREEAFENPDSGMSFLDRYEENKESFLEILKKDLDDYALM